MQQNDFSQEIKFTQIYKKYKNDNIVIREAQCLKVMYPASLGKIDNTDLLAGRISLGHIGFSPEQGGLGYFCNSDALKNALNNHIDNEKLNREIMELIKFWEVENTSYKVRKAYPPNIAKTLSGDRWMEEPYAASPLYRMGGSCLDYEKLIKNGIPGMKKEITDRSILAEKQGEDVVLFEGMKIALDILVECCLYYSKMAKNIAEKESDATRAGHLNKMIVTLENIAYKKPETLMEAIQLFWLYSLISGSQNHGRMDDYLGDFLVNDLNNGILNLHEAQELINSLWRLIAARKTIYNGRVIVGGKGRKNEENSDKFAMLAMEASRVVKEVEPQLSLRFYKGMNELLMDKALEVLGEGRTFPLLYNDDINIEAVSNAFNINIEEAEQYVPFGCGECVINHRSFGTPSGLMNHLKILEITLRNGIDAVTGKRIGLKTGDFKDFQTFEQLFNAYKKQVEYFVDALAQQEEIEYKVAGETAPFLYLSMLYDDCIERGKGIFSGGVRYLGGTLETYGNINTADSLTAIKEVVYDKKLISNNQLITALDADFADFEDVRKLLLDAPKYGNDNEIADEMAVKVHEHVCNAVRNQIKRVNLHSYLVVVINNSANTYLGKFTAASADGRKKFVHMANANNPFGGCDKKGLTAMLNSLVKLNPSIHAGTVQNMKFSPELFKNNKTIVKSVLKTYFEKGGTQAMITVINKNDLEKAIRKPEKYNHVFVRVGGFSARFVDLDKALQLEILSRTHY